MTNNHDSDAIARSKGRKPPITASGPTPLSADGMIAVALDSVPGSGGYGGVNKMTLRQWLDEGNRLPAFRHRRAVRRLLDALAKPAPVMGDDAELAGELREFEGSDALGNGDFSVCARAATRLQQLSAEVAQLRDALATFARCPAHGKCGGPFVIANAIYEDMMDGASAPREAYWHKSDFDKARAALSQPNEGTG